MQVQSEVKVSRSESLVIVIAVAVCLAAIILALPTAGSSGNIPSLSAGNLEIPIAGTITVALLVVIVALPLAFFSAVCVFMLPHTAKEKMFTVLLVIAQSPLTLWGFAAAVPLLASTRIWSPTASIVYLAIVLGSISFPRLTIQILANLESTPATWRETLFGLGGSRRQIFQILIIPKAQRATFRNLLPIMAFAALEGAISLLILHSPVTLATSISADLVGRLGPLLVSHIASHKVPLLILLTIHTVTQLGACRRPLWGGVE
ncbi:MAG: hypothetical protein GX030_06530 [Firmicutes bacterium]|nr:hypothetical protein [Bacillota bacterium]